MDDAKPAWIMDLVQRVLTRYPDAAERLQANPDWVAQIEDKDLKMALGGKNVSAYVASAIAF